MSEYPRGGPINRWRVMRGGSLQWSRRNDEGRWHPQSSRRDGTRGPGRWAPRWLHRLYANTCGYFWSPCPLCGEPSGGHQWRHGDSIPDGKRRSGGQGICRHCGDVLRKAGMLPR